MIQVHRVRLVKRDVVVYSGRWHCNSMSDAATKKQCLSFISKSSWCDKQMLKDPKTRIICGHGALCTSWGVCEVRTGLDQNEFQD